MMKKLNLNLLILVTLFQKSSGDFVYIKEQEKIGSKSQLIQNLVEYLPETVITRVVTVRGEKLDDNKGKGLVVQNFNITRDGIKNSDVSLRKKRAGDVTTSDNELHCLSCFANGSSSHDQNCYEAQNIPNIKCIKGERCYSELNPDYVRRGCKLKSLLKGTYVCNCPLCNDKPFDEVSYYDYKNTREWRHHNERLEMPLVGIDIICKLCETNGTSNKTNNICRIGKNANFTVCKRNQLCYMNVDGKSDHVSRGCIDRPKYNSIYFFCHTPLCNNMTLFYLKPLPKQTRIFNFESSAVYLTPFSFVNLFLIYVYNIII